jgi:hypothetical protein
MRKGYRAALAKVRMEARRVPGTDAQPQTGRPAR